MRVVLVCCVLMSAVACGEAAIDAPFGGGRDATLPIDRPDANVLFDAGGSDAAWLPTHDAAMQRDGSQAHDAALDPRDAQVAHDASRRDASIGDANDDGAVTSGTGEYQNVFVDGNSVSIYVPRFTDPTTRVPVVLSLHGLSIPAIAMADITGLPAVADREGFIAIFPNGTSGTWNTGGAVCGLGSFTGNTADDVAYVGHLLDAADALHPIDRARVFVSGFSMGGYGTNALACRHPEMFRGAAPAAGGFPTGLCGTARLPVMIFHGTADATISHQCGVEARAAWVAHNGCAAEVDVMPVMGGKCEWSRGCPEGGQVVFCSFEGMGHGWAGSINPFALGGAQYESATALMWSFFETYR